MIRRFVLCAALMPLVEAGLTAPVQAQATQTPAAPAQDALRRSPAPPGASAAAPQLKRRQPVLTPSAPAATQPAASTVSAPRLNLLNKPSKPPALGLCDGS